MRRRWCLVLLWVLVPHTIAAQGGASITLSTEQGLSFGTLLPGQTEAVSVMDVARRGTVSVTGNGSVQIRLIIPDALQSLMGTASLPLLFSAADAGVLYPQSSRPEVFDPVMGTTINLNRAKGHARVVVGASADVGSGLPAGPYQGTIVVVVSSPDT